MNDLKPPLHVIQNIAKPLHLQRLEAALDMGPFMQYARNIINRPLSSSDGSDSDDNFEQIGDRCEDKYHIYNFSQLGPQRRWIQDILLSESENDSEISDEDEHIRNMLKTHVRDQKIRKNYYKNATNSQYGYYGAGLLSNIDYFLENQKSIIGDKKRRKNRTKKTERIKKARKMKMNQDFGDDDGLGENSWDGQNLSIKEEMYDDEDSKPQSLSDSLMRKKSRKKLAMIKTPEVMAARRRKVWQLMAKKELGKIQRAKTNNHKEQLTNCKRVASLCMKMARQKAMQSQKNMKETVWRAKRLTREMQSYWKRYDRVERETRRRMEKEAEEQRKMDVEIVEAKRQQRKLNFLITQTELYAHFMSKKLGNGTEEEQLRILSQLDEEMNPRLAAIDDYDSELMKQLAQKNACDAFMTEKARTQQFNVMTPAKLLSLDEIKVDLPQPNIFHGSLKGYQIKGMTWLANLYDQGISGILADEMGLGKTVQSIAFLCHIAENYGVWGPFLIISPASTLHNWQQEMQRFVPEFNVVPYWGSPNERKILRQFWEQKDLHTKEASFHVVITSYQLVVSDYKYFNRIKWQYMILDEAQAIKSSSSVRWKLLLGFNCRNRLLLSGTPIQNSMAELWALLHFIMPTLFDSHDEFNEWFSKDIESHAENKTGIDEKQISRLHMILKPFMLRRIKKDVENELSDKIEIMKYCPLTTRQKLLYIALKKKIRIEDLLNYSSNNGDGHSIDKNFTSNLMNLVMQFRKVCNHPELFERRDAKSPFYIKCVDFVLPRLLFEDGLLMRSFPSRKHLLYNKFNIFKSEYVHRTFDSTFFFARLINLSAGDIETSFLGDLIQFFINASRTFHQIDFELEMKNREWKNDLYNWRKCMLLEPTIENPVRNISAELEDLIFTKMPTRSGAPYTFATHKIMSMPESMEHRVIRSKNRLHKNLIEEIKEEPCDDGDEGPSHRVIQPLRSPTYLIRSPLKSPTHLIKTSLKSPIAQRSSVLGKSGSGPDIQSPVKQLHGTATLLPEFTYIPRPPRKIPHQATAYPSFLYDIGPKVQSKGHKLYCDSRAAQWAIIRHEQCENELGQTLINSSLECIRPKRGWSHIIIPDKQTLVSDAGKLFVLDQLLTQLKAQGHRVLIYSQMTKMIDLLEEYMWHRKHRYMRLDGSSKISARRDMVADFQNRADIFVFLLSTRAGGLGINLTAADTVIFYDSDWNPTVDQQAMDRAHRLGQTKQVTVYRLICKGTIEERILQRAREKSEIQRMVISGGNFKPDTLKPKEVVSLLLDDEEIELKYRQKTEEKKYQDDMYYKLEREKEKKRKLNVTAAAAAGATTVKEPSKRIKTDIIIDGEMNLFDCPISPAHSDNSQDESSSRMDVPGNDDSSNEALIVDCDSPAGGPSSSIQFYDGLKPRRRHHPRGTRRGRPRGSRRGGGNSGCLSPRVYDSTKQAAGGADSSMEGASTSQTPPQIKRGPGRPRLNTTGPINRGYRGAPRLRKPIGPLVVPLGQSPAPTPTVRSPAMSPAPHSSQDMSGIGFYQPMDDETV